MSKGKFVLVPGLVGGTLIRRMASDDEIDLCCHWGCIWVPQARVWGDLPSPKFVICWEKFCFSWGHPWGTECSIDKPKGTKISLQTDSVYLGSSENTDGGWQP